jgi:tetratricopeptide (TPR) repeat protein
MRTEWLEAHAQLLSVPPVFDEGTATAVGEHLADRLSVGAAAASQYALRELRLSGLVVRESTAWRIIDPLRGQLRRRLQTEHLDVFQETAEQVVSHAQNGLGATFRRVLGVRGAEVTLAWLRMASNPKSDEHFDNLIDVVEHGAYLGRNSEAAAAVVLLRRLPEVPERSRQVEFLSGLAAWGRGEREQALEHFSRVLRGDHIDRAAAVAAHLTGVTRAAQGNNEAAIAHLQHSVDVNRQLGLQRGLALTLISLGRVRRNFGAQLEITTVGHGVERLDVPDVAADSQLDGAIEALEEAIEISEELGDNRLLGIALIELAVTHQRQQRLDLAVTLAQDAVQRIPESDPEIVHAYTVLGSLYKDQGDQRSAAEVLVTGAARARVTGAGSLAIASLLNVLASSERHGGRYKDALEHARLSVEIGREIGNDRHLSQALHTLGSILGDQAKTKAQYFEAEQALAESEVLLRKLGDVRGLRMVATTRASLGMKSK